MGTRLRADLSEHLTIIGAVFDGNAAGPGQNDPQLRDRYGVNFRVNDPPLVIGEAQFLWNEEKGDPGLDGKFKLGAWRHFGDFASERFDVNGLSLANLYAVFEQKLYRIGNDDDRGIGVFARAAYSPPDRNLIDLYADAGLELIGLSDSRPHDKFGVAAAYAHVSPAAQALDDDFRQFQGPFWPKRTGEELLTAVYQYEVRAGWTLQPNFQYIFHPGGGATNPLTAPAGKPIKDAAVLGLRTVVKFWAYVVLELRDGIVGFVRKGVRNGD